MSDRSLRDALEALAADYATIDAEQITDLLAAHPVEPAHPLLADLDGYNALAPWLQEVFSTDDEGVTWEQASKALAAVIAPDIRYVHQEATEATQNAIIDKRANKLADAMLALLKGGQS